MRGVCERGERFGLCARIGGMCDRDRIGVDCGGFGWIFGLTREFEVGDEDVVFAEWRVSTDEDVVGFQIAVHEAGFVRCCDVVFGCAQQWLYGFLCARMLL